MRYSFGMLFLASIFASVMLISCSSQNGEKMQDMAAYDSAGSDHSIPKESSSASIENEQTSYDDNEEPFSTGSTEDEIPWGFSERSYQMCRSGALDFFIPNGSEAEQCVIADLDMDGIEDVLLSYSVPNDTTDLYSFDLNTLILKGTGDGSYELAAENPNVNTYSSYDGSAALEAGDGWFKLTRARGTAGGYVYSYFFEYDEEREDWFLNTYYSNWFGYTEEGRSTVQTPDNFGSISFEDFNNYTDSDAGDPEGAVSEEELTIAETDFKIDVSPCYVNLKDKEKEYRMNKMIADHAVSMIDQFRELDTNVDISLYGTTTYMTPQIICMEYKLSGTIDGDRLNYSGVNRKYITAMFDIERARQITLSEIVDIEKLYHLMKQEGVVYRGLDSDTAWETFQNMEENECMELLKSSDSLQAAFGTENTGIFSSIYEKSVCVYFQPEFIGMGPYCEEPKLYIPLEKLLPVTKSDYWELPEDKLSRIEWMG